MNESGDYNESFDYPENRLEKDRPTTPHLRLHPQSSGASFSHNQRPLRRHRACEGFNSPHHESAKNSAVQWKFCRFKSCILFSYSFWFYTFRILYLLLFQTVLASEAEEKLVRDLFRDYNKLIRPVELINETLDVAIRVYLIQLINVNEKNQVMTSNVWLDMQWNDYQLKWNPADYDGIELLRLPADKVWKPDIVLFNNADGNYEVRYQSNILISPNGAVQWVPPAIFQSSCRIDVTYFPFDQQTCEMKFSSWTYNGDQVSLSFQRNDRKVILSDYVKSGTWDIVDVPGYVSETQMPGGQKEVAIFYQITIRRKTLFYTVNLILPTLLISFLCILVFYLPAEAGEKVTLGISVLLALVVFLLLVSKILPPTSLVLPLIAKYLLFTFIIMCFEILVTVVIINWNFRGPRTHRMANWVKLIFLKYLPGILLMKRPKRTRLRWMTDMNSASKNHRSSSGPHNRSTRKARTLIDSVELSEVIDASNPIDITDGLDRPCSAAHHPYGHPMAHSSSSSSSYRHHPNCATNYRAFSSSAHNNFAHSDSGVDMLCLTPEAYEAGEAIEFIAEHLKSEDEYIQIREDWKYVAMVIDRLQLYLFFLGTLLGTTFILLDAPHIFEYVDQDAVIRNNSGKTLE